MTVRLEWEGEGSLLRGSGAADGWRNRLIWGDNKLVMSSLPTRTSSSD